MKFAKYYDVTKTMNEMIKKGQLFNYEQSCLAALYVCKDTHDMWIARIYKDLDSEFNFSEDTYLIDRERLDLYDLAEFIANEKDMDIYINSRRDRDIFIDEIDTKELIEYTLLFDEDNGFESWDNIESTSIENVRDIIDDGYGIEGGY